MHMAWIRERVKNVPRYKGQITWIDKVNRMPDMQVYAIHMTFLRDGMYGEKINEHKKSEPVQMTLFDIFPEAMNNK